MNTCKKGAGAGVFRLVAGVFAAFALCAGCASPKNKQKTYEFAEVRRGSIEKTVSSTGTLKPVATVKVLPRMSGKVERLMVDFNDTVKKGEVLAELNTDMLRLQREQQLAAVVKSRANYELQQINYKNQQALAEKNLISEYELKTSKTTLDSQAADLAVAEANLKVIETEINQYAYITSPIDGTVLERNINVGDTVVDSSSNNSSSIFTIAENLKEMQIEAGVGELDVASIYKGQAVRFTLESLPGRSFTGTVDTLRLVPVVQNNVVSYTVIINVENQDGSLLPGMTCAVDFIVEQRQDVLLVPNAALRYQPSGLSETEIADLVFNAGLQGMNEEQRAAALAAREPAKTAAAPGQSQSSGLNNIMMGAPPGGMRGMGMGGGRPPSQQARTPAGGESGQRQRSAVTLRTMWYLNSDGKPAVLRVRAGISNGTSTEVSALDDIEGRQIIVREKI
jgi:HlyD family secretion protein